jgi:long-chain acyl-CoA synthetase
LIPVLLNATLTPAERDALAEDAQPTLRIFDESAVAELVESGDTPVELAPYPLTRPMHYTSGTTGQPKGVTTGIWDDKTARQVYEDEDAVWHFDHKDLHLVCSPMYHTVSIRFSSNTLLAGGSLAILGRFDAATALDLLRRHRPTTTFLVPTHLQRILQLPELGADETFDSIRLLAHAGAPCPESVKRATMARVPPGAVWEFYGSTEAQYTVCPPDEWLEHPGTVGRARAGRRLSLAPIAPIGDEHATAQDDADDAHDPAEGTIWCDMPDFARFSYWRDPEATSQAWRGTACTVGDLGRLNPDGYLYLTGRRHDLIISGGVNVYPAEVENVLAAVEGVREVAVFGLADDRWGQRVCAAYVADSTSAEGALRAAASSRLAPYKRPKAYFATRELPHTATGKLMRRAVPDHLGLDVSGPSPR